MKRSEKVIKRIVPLSVELIRYGYNDLAALTGVYHYPQPVIFIAGLPKSGTTWLQNMLAELPGFNIRRIKDDDQCSQNHDVCDQIFQSLPYRRRYTVMKLHTHYSPQNYEVICRYVDRFIVTVRDLRDMAVSRYHHIYQDPRHPLYSQYQSLSFEAGMKHSIMFTGEFFTKWVNDWLNIATEQPNKIMVVRYRDLNQHTTAVLKRLFAFYGFDVNDKLIQNMVKSKLTVSKDLKRELAHRLGGRLTSTARKGKVGSWQEEMSAPNQELANQLLGETNTRMDNLLTPDHAAST